MKSIYIIIEIFLLISCDGRLDEMHPHNQAEANSYLNSFNNIVNATSGLYGQFLRQAGGYTHGNNYHGTFHALGEFRGNNIVFNEAFPGSTGDAVRCPDIHFFLNSDQKAQSFAWPMWTKSLQLILGASQNIIAIDKLYAESVNPDEKEKLIRLKGENYFIRGLMVFNATNVFGRPYWDEPDKNLGIPLDIKAEAKELPRNTVKQCFDQAVSDFKAAAACLPDEISDRTFANKAASLGMVSKVYLFMGGCMEFPNKTYNKLAIDYADSIFNLKNDIVDVLRAPELADLYENPKHNKEILFAFFLGNYPIQIGNIIHNYYSWSGYESHASTSQYCCVISRDYEKIIDKSNDLRWQYFTEPSRRHTGRYCTKKYNGGKYYAFADYANFQAPTIFLRLAEVYLNRAEAYVKIGENGKALADLNVIRERSGLSPLSEMEGQALFDEIFLERRRELAFEAQTYYDYVRNGIKQSREDISAGYPQYIDTQYNEIDPKTQRWTMCLIPSEEIILNKALKQNQY